MRPNFWKILILVIFVLGAVIFSARLLSGEDDWICVDGHWVKHGMPGAPQPVSGCGNVAVEPTADSNKMVRLENPAEGTEVVSPLLVKGSARGSWYFEGSFPIKLVDKAGSILARGVATAKGVWMTEDFVPFEAELLFNIEQDMDAFLILERDNPSGLPENNASVSVSLRLKAR